MSLTVEMKTVLAVCATVVCALAVVAPGVASAAKPPPLTPVAHDALTRALDRGELTEAQYALERARSLFSLGAVRREFGDVARPGPRQATPILRDLAARYRSLTASQRVTARDILARPNANQSACDSVRPLCYHWVTSGPNAASPDDVAQTEATVAAVYDLEVGTYGYLPPLSDGIAGGNSSTDIYLRDVGSNGLFGYCTTDDPSPSPSGPYYDVPAYCVLDNDFSPRQFGTSQTPQEFRDVTAAHEFFHAIQFHYDWFEDLWLMEGTAMLMEGQFRPDVEDRVRYLTNSALTSPETPVDSGAEGFRYGAWIFWRFLVEEMADPPIGSAPTPLNPLLIRQIWERTAGASIDTDGSGPDTVARNEYSLEAARRSVAARGSSFGALFGEFARVNRTPARFYSEGASYPRAPLSNTYYLGRSRRGTGWQSTRLRHLASRYYAFKPGSTASPNGSLRVRIDLPRRWLGPEAYLLVRRTSGSLYVRKFALDSDGDGVRSVAFGRGAIREVDLVLTNASTRMSCWRNTDYSCSGVGADDLRYYKFRATVR
jgi:hypothetical protein